MPCSYFLDLVFVLFVFLGVLGYTFTTWVLRVPSVNCCCKCSFACLVFVSPHIRWGTLRVSEVWNHKGSVRERLFAFSSQRDASCRRKFEKWSRSGTCLRQFVSHHVQQTQLAYVCAVHPEGISWERWKIHIPHRWQIDK